MIVPDKAYRNLAHYQAVKLPKSLGIALGGMGSCVAISLRIQSGGVNVA